MSELTKGQLDTLLTLGKRISQGLEMAQKSLIASGIAPADAHAMVVANSLGQVVAFSNVEIVKKSLELGEELWKKEYEDVGTSGTD